LVHCRVKTDGKTACEQSGRYADPLPCEKRPLSKGSRDALRDTFLSRAQRCVPQN
jgi:hypothetical protein